MLLVVDYGMSNLRSVAKAVERLGTPVKVSGRVKDVEVAEKIILPGVGAFGDAMKELQKRKLNAPLREAIAQKRPFLGICLGLQLLFDASEESPSVKGLGVVPGRVVRFKGGRDFKVPHMGWNRVLIRRKNCPLLKGVASGSFFYFVHSYYVVPEDEDAILAQSEYGKAFTSMIWRDRVFGAQFHPEKSQDLGLKMIENFVRM